MDNHQPLFLKQTLSQPPEQNSGDLFIRSIRDSEEIQCIRNNDSDKLKLSSVHKQLSSQFIFNHILGRGAFATVYAARRHPDSSWHIPVAIKVINLDEVTARRRKRRLQDLPRGTHKDHSNQKIFNEGKEGDNDDTDELFFPSRVVDITRKRRASLHNVLEDHDKQKLANCVQGDEYGDDKNDFAAVWDMISREIEVHRYVSQKAHPNIVSLLQSFHEDKASSLLSGVGYPMSMAALVMEYCSGGDLHTYLKRKRDAKRRTKIKNSSHGDFSSRTLLDENEARHALRHILRGLAFLHSHGITHRDIKPGNIFIVRNGIYPPRSNNDDSNSDDKQFSLVDCTLKIGDFGLAVKMSDDDDWDEAQHTLCGTPSCIAPEIALSAPVPLPESNIESQSSSSKRRRKQKSSSNEEAQMDKNGYGQPADLWSTGCVFYAMLVGRYPFSRPQKVNDVGHKQRPIDPDNRVREMIDRAVKGEWSVPDYINMSSIARALLQKLLSLNPSERGFARGLLSMHPFFTNRASFSSGSSSHSSLSSREASTSSMLSFKSQTDVCQEKNEQQKQSNTQMNDILLSKIRQRMHQEDDRKDFDRLQHVPKDNSERSLISELERRRSSIQCHFVNPIQNMHEMIPMKYQWTELKLKRSGSGHPVALDFTVFILPRRNGIVIQCERQRDSKGVWMHVTEDGSQIYKGELTKELEGISIDPNISKGEDMLTSNNLIDQAFARSPRKLKQFYHHNRSNMGTQKMAFTATNNEANVHQSLGMNVGLPMHSTLHSSPSAHTMPARASKIQSCSQTTYNKGGSGCNEYSFPCYKQLSSLLSEKSTKFLVLYRKLESVCMRVKSNLSDLSMNIYVQVHQQSKSTDKGGARKIMCKVTTFHQISSHSTYIVITYYDGVQIRYNASNERGEILDNGKKVGNFLIRTDGHRHGHRDRDQDRDRDRDRNRDRSRLQFQMALTNDRQRRMYSFHLRFASDAVEKFKSVLLEDLANSRHEFDQGNAAASRSATAVTTENPMATKIPIKIVVQGRSFHDWIRVS